MNIPKEFRTPSKPTKVVITDESGTKVVCGDWCEKCDGVTAHETRCVQCSVKPQPIFDDTSDISELRAELALAKRYLRQALAAHNPRSRLSCDIRRLIGMNPIGAKAGEVGHE